MLGDSTVLGSSGSLAAAGGEHEGGFGEDDRSFGVGNRWPRQETLALLKARSDMDVAFREASVKCPLWDDVSRKLGELGYHRSGKKCREKFENVYKYHKRTKEGRCGKGDNGKTYRFFEQLEALENHHNSLQPPAMPNSSYPSSTNPHIVAAQNFSSWLPNMSTTEDPLSNSSTSEGRQRRKRKWKDLFERLMKELMKKQEELEKKFMDAIEKREHERMAREEAWRLQEMSRMSREREILAQERSIAEAKDAAVMSFLQKLSDTHQNNNILRPPEPVAPVNANANANVNNNGDNCIGENYCSGSGIGGSRWPKVEVQALIQLRTSLDSKYQDTSSGTKGTLWEEVSSGMRKLGYNRSSKRCKEKWENINKYFKKVKESNKKRPEDSKTCPYFQQLDALYQDRNNPSSSLSNQNGNAPLMVRPEQQWPPPPQHPDDEEDLDEGGHDEYELVSTNLSTNQLLSDQMV